MTDLYTKKITVKDRRLGRTVVHDVRSRSFPVNALVNTNVWRSRTIRVYDPFPNLDQCHGECTMCSKATQFNALGNRRRGKILDMAFIHEGYKIATNRDPFPGAWPPDDTGSSGLASCIAAQELGAGGDYRWFFGGADEIVTYLSTEELPIPISNGTWWTDGMFRKINSRGTVIPSGSKAGGHQWCTIGYDERYDETVNVCMWGSWRKFRLSREHHNDLLMDDGDAHIQKRVL